MIGHVIISRGLQSSPDSGKATALSATTLSLPPCAGAAAGAAAFNAGLMKPKRMISATSTSAAGVAPLRTRSISQSCFQTGRSCAFGIASALNGALISFTESPRSFENPIASCTSEVSFSIYLLHFAIIFAMSRHRLIFESGLSPTADALLNTLV